MKLETLKKVADLHGEACKPVEAGCEETVRRVRRVRAVVQGFSRNLRDGQEEEEEEAVFEELNAILAGHLEQEVPAASPERMPCNRGVGRERKGSATSGSTVRFLEDRGAHEGKEEAEVDGRENASGYDVESAGTLLSTIVGVLVQEHRGARNGWASACHSLRRWVLLGTAQLQGVVARSFSLARPSLAALFSSAHRRVAVAGAVVREAKRQQRRRQSGRG